MIRVALAGHRGRTGGEVARALAAADDVDYVGGVGRGDDLAAFLESARPQVLVDFTHPSVALEHALAAVGRGVAPVVGTTGLAPDAVGRLEAACREAGVGGVVAPNFAVGAVLMMHLASIAAPYFDAVEVIEMHHAGKADAPSGTALATARRLSGRGKFSYNQPEKTPLQGTRGGVEGNVAVHSVRLPGLVADQEVLFGLPGQTLALTHRTTSREAFAPGVLLAVRQVAREPRFFRGLEELLDLH
ncbi:MAG: 4-hydroxy-tetrahydrodipicolinate reductase [Candidatus Nephthysia bennettiae]|uniref:4-hydroxy-tetrahydrodipicolinate reductase n=1 Tax=Candidatus Nephthysia bennettiae TaxID=3127016 RepID=A0A934K6P6_9BACT|nr:4-hydroxy-tetrahydrodipicolinate reductase [Candidatus Dormibacteraeota bacterium]MBJ7611225.1 4-hydroxy-tetrahydrodipicolinate reductase [Candidatus Dormibacteraeota bacterium]PZR93229.1 MAG: 4-hydroxy-tetrahydrodipicolinate reductase [Candidatus Dormibacteraeota bacterium]